MYLKVTADTNTAEISMKCALSIQKQPRALLCDDQWSTYRMNELINIGMVVISTSKVVSLLVSERLSSLLVFSLSSTQS